MPLYMERHLCRNPAIVLTTYPRDGAKGKLLVAPSPVLQFSFLHGLTGTTARPAGCFSKGFPHRKPSSHRKVPIGSKNGVKALVLGPEVDRYL